MRLASFIAGRYLFARKSHNVINVISAISVVGVGLAYKVVIIPRFLDPGFGRAARRVRV